VVCPSRSDSKLVWFSSRIRSCSLPCFFWDSTEGLFFFEEFAPGVLMGRLSRARSILWLYLRLFCEESWCLLELRPGLVFRLIYDLPLGFGAGFGIWSIIDESLSRSSFFSIMLGRTGDCISRPLDYQVVPCVPEEFGP